MGAVLRIGKRGDRGSPVERDRFYVALPDKVDNVRPLHPDFAIYNKAAPNKRRNVRARLVHGNLRDAFDLQRFAWGLPNHERPDGQRPTCQGDGERAIRYVEGEFQEIPCPGDLCEFWACKACKQRLKIRFYPVWNDDRLPSPLTDYTSRGEHMETSLYGLFDFVANVAYEVGLLAEKPAETEGYKALEEHGVPVFGLPFMISLSEKTSKKAGGRRFPVVRFSPDGDIMAWMLGMKRNLEELSEGHEPLALPASVADDPDEVIAADMEEVDPDVQTEPAADDSEDWTEKAEAQAAELYEEQGLFDEDEDAP